MIRKNTVCLWYDGTALDAATFYQSCAQNPFL